MIDLPGDIIKSQMVKQHAAAWTEYFELLDAMKKAYFGEKNFRNTIGSNFDSEKPLNFTFNRKIIEVLIEYMLYDPDDEGTTVSRDRALKIFVLSKSAGSDSESEPDLSDDDVQGTRGVYKVSIKKPRLFNLVIGFVA